MSKYLASWYRARQLLKIPECLYKKGWPKCFNAYELALMQEPENTNEREIIIQIIEASSMNSSAERNPENWDIGRVKGILLSDVQYAETSDSPKIKLYQAKDFETLLINSDIESCNHVVEWFEARGVTNSEIKQQHGFNGDKDKTKREKQQTAILESILKKGYNQMKIPDGGKGILRQTCEVDFPDLFDGDSSFDNAWKNSRSLFCMANQASFAKRGK